MARKSRYAEYYRGALAGVENTNGKGAAALQ